MISEENEYLSKFDSYQKVIIYKDEPDNTYVAAAFSNPNLLQMMGISEYDPTVYCEAHKDNMVQDKKVARHTFEHEGKND